MKRLLALFLCLGAAGITACQQDRAEDGLRVPDTGPRPGGVEWGAFKSSPGREDLIPLKPNLFDVPVTVRTDSGRVVTVFGRQFDTEGEQVWIHGRSDDSGDPPRAQQFEEAPFWTHAGTLGSLIAVKEALADDGVVSIPSEDLGQVAPLLMNVEELQNLPPEDRASLEEALRTGDLGKLSAPRRALLVQAARSAAIPDTIFFRVNGMAVGMQPVTSHEGRLKRIHIDTPTDGENGEVTVIGYYSGSTARPALELPKKACIWCGDNQVCTADPECPAP